MTGKYARNFLLAGLWALMAASLAACGSDSTTTTAGPSGGNMGSVPVLNMNFPQSLTGAEAVAPATLRSALVNARAAHGEPHCFFEGAGNEDPFKDGYNMTKFLVSAVAQWQCITDFLIIGFAALPVPADGTFYEIPPDPDDPDGLTGIRITDNSSTQRTIELFVNGDTVTAGVYISWSVADGVRTGRLIVTSAILNDPTDPDFDPEGPDNLRMDFSSDGATQTADMIISFPSANPWANAFRIDAVKTVSDSSFVVRGIMNMKGQWDPGYQGLAVPALKMFAVSDSTGLGAAKAEMTDIGTNFDLGPSDSLGSYNFTMSDRYYFLATGASEWINKSISSAAYAGGTRTALAGTLTFVEGILGLSAGYFTSTCAATVGADCTQLFTSLFTIGLGSEDLNSPGPEPTGNRMAALDTGTFLVTGCPADAGSCTFDNTDVFAQSFTP